MNEETLFHLALEKSSPQERAAFLDRACAGQPQLRGGVEALLLAHEGAGGFLNRPPLSEALTCDIPPGQETDTTRLDDSGTVIGPYKLLQPIGEGGMGVVWMAEQRVPVSRKVALKIIKPGMDSQQVIARFEAERQALALMDHPNVAKILDAGCTATGRPYFVMELVKGTPITTYCDEQRLPLSKRLELFISVCQAIQHAHQKGIIHRDIKPSNVLVAPYDGKPVVKIIDFGIAKAMGQKLTERTLFTQFGAVVGTLQYMSPEQAELNNLDIDTRSDIYSLGVLLYELLTGTTPLDMKQLQGAAFVAILMQIQEQEPPRPSVRLSESKESLPSISAQRQIEPARLARQVRGDLDWIAMKSLDKDRNRRYDTASAFAADVERYLRVEPIQARPPSLRYRFRKFVRRNKGLVFALAVILVVACIGMLAELDSLRALNNAGHAYSELNIESYLLVTFLEGQLLHGWESQNRNPTIREGLDRASKNVEAYCQGRKHTEARARQILGLAYMDMDAQEPAEIQLAKAVQLYRRLLDNDPHGFDESGLFAMTSLASLYARQKRYADEARLRIEVVIRYRQEKTDNSLDSRRHNRTAALYSLGECQVNRGQLQQAEPLFAEVIQECRGPETALNQILGKNNLLSSALIGHAKCLIARDDFAEAAGELREALDLMKSEPADSKDRANVDALLVECRKRAKE